METAAFMKGFLHFLSVGVYQLTRVGPHQLELLRNSEVVSNLLGYVVCRLTEETHDCTAYMSS